MKGKGISKISAGHANIGGDVYENVTDGRRGCGFFVIIIVVLLLLIVLYLTTSVRIYSMDRQSRDHGIIAWFSRRGPG